MPSSYGYVRCLDYLGIANSTQATYGLAGASLNGSCAAMIWSGHTAGVILAIYYTRARRGPHAQCTPTPYPHTVHLPFPR